MKKSITKLSVIILCLVGSFVGLNAQHTINFYTNYIHSCDSMDVQVINSSFIDIDYYSGPVIYEWYLDGTYVSSSDSSFYIKLYAGLHEIEQKAYTDTYELLGSYSVPLEVSSLPVAFESTKGFTVCPGEDVLVYYQVTNEADYNATWDFGDGTNQSGNWVGHSYQNPGTYLITLIVDGVCGMDTIIREMTVTESAVPQVVAKTWTDNSFCPDDIVHLGIEGRFKSYQWEMGNEIFSYAREAKTSFSLVGTYDVIATATNVCGNKSSDTVTLNIINDLNAFADMSYEYTGSLCPGTPIAFQSNSKGKTRWIFDDIFETDLSSPVFVPDTASDYTVTLIVENGCGSSDTVSETIFVDYTYETEMENVHFRFKEEENKNADTLFVCPGEKFALVNETQTPDLKYYWIIDDTDTIESYHLEHDFTDQGDHSVYLMAVNSCMGSMSSMMKTIRVDTNVQPDVQLKAGPFLICPGEAVYFFDENIHDNIRYQYHIDYGDGHDDTDIHSFSDPNLHTLTRHVYEAAGEYNYVFTATNACNNSSSVEGLIEVEENQTKPGFYYIQNSTQNEEDHVVTDWSKRMDETDFKITIPVVWPDWYTDLDSTFYAYFWYGGIRPEDDHGVPDGFVKLQTDKISTGDTLIAYVPFSAMDRTVGFIVGWHCNSDIAFLNEPDHFTMPMNASENIENIDIVSNGSLDITSLTAGNPVEFSDWSGVCNSEKLEGEWLADKGDGYALLLEFWADEQGNQKFYLHQGPANNKQEYLVSEGYYNYFGTDSIELSSLEGECFGWGAYKFEIFDNKLHFVNAQDECDARLNDLANYTYERYEGDHHDMAACPGEPVMFTIAGGTSYEWHFQDGTIDTGKTVYHTYSEPGEFNEYVVVTNGCGGSDTIYTNVRVSENNFPLAGFQMDRYNMEVGDIVHLKVPDDIVSQHIAEYYWDFGDGKGASSPNVSHVFDKPGNYLITLKAINGCGVTDFQQEIHVIGNTNGCELNADFDIDLVDHTITLYDQTTNGAPTSYFWDFGDQTSSQSPNPTHSYSGNGLFQVRLKVYDSISGCSDDIVKEIQLGNSSCYADFEHMVVGKDSVLFVDKSNGSVTDWTWEFGSGEISEKQNPLHVFPKSGYYKVTLSTMDEGGCYATQTKEVLIDSNDENVCYVSFVPEIKGLEVNLNLVASPTITSACWMMGDGNVVCGKETTYTFEKKGEYKVCVVGIDTVNNCQARDCKVIRVGEADCYADFSYVITDDGAVDFINKSEGGNFKASWNFGDGNMEAAMQPSHRYAKPGEYNVSLSIINDTIRCLAQTEKYVQISSDSATEIYCKPEMSYFTDAGTSTYKFDETSGRSFTSYYWTFDDNGFSTLKSPVHTFENPGNYEVCLHVRDAQTGCSEVICEVIPVMDVNNNLVPVSADFNVFPVFNSKMVVFKDNSQGNVTSRNWTFGDGKTISDSIKTAHIYKEAGTYEVCLVVADEANNMVSKKCKEVVAGDRDCNLIADFKYNVDPENQMVSFINRSVGNVNKVSWYFDDGTGAYEQNPVHVYDAQGYYNVKLAVKDTNNQCFSTTRKRVQVGANNCNAAFQYTVDHDSLIVRFKNKSTVSNTRFYWLFGDKTMSTEIHPVKKYKSPGQYPVTLTVSNIDGTCSDIYQTSIQVGEVACDADFEVYVDSSTNIAFFKSKYMGDVKKYHWYFGDGHESVKENPIHAFPAPGYYTVRHVVSNADKLCIDKQEKTILVGHPGKDCEADFYWNVDNETRKVSFISTSFGEGLSYKWVFGDGDSTETENPEHSYEMANYYDVCLTIMNNQEIVNTTCKSVPVAIVDTLNCNAEFIYEVDSASRTVKFMDISSGQPDKWRWNFGDSTGISGDYSPLHGYASAGYYIVQMVIANSTSGCVDAHYELINVGEQADGLRAGFGYVIDSLLWKSSGKPVDFVGIATGKPSSFAWKFGDGNTNNSSLTPTNIYTQSGLYQVSFSVTDPNTGGFSSFTSDVLIEFLSATKAVLTENLDAIVYPNPFRDNVFVHFYLDRKTRVTIEVLDELGRTIEIIEDNELDVGINHMVWDGSEVKQGIYILRFLTGDGQQKIMRIVKQ